MASTKWINRFVQMWNYTKKDGSKARMLSLPLAEPVTIKLQRYKNKEFFIEEVTLTPTVNAKGFSSLAIFLDKLDRSVTLDNGNTFERPENLTHEGTIPPPKDDSNADF